MLTARQPASPSDGEPPEARPAAPLTSIQRFEAPDAVEDAHDPVGPAQQPPAPVGEPPAVWPPVDHQTTSGVPATPVADPATGVGPPASAEITQRIAVAPATEDPETTQRLFRPATQPPATQPPAAARPVNPAAVRPVPGEMRRRLNPPATAPRPDPAAWQPTTTPADDGVTQVLHLGDVVAPAAPPVPADDSPTVEAPVPVAPPAPTVEAPVAVAPDAGTGRRLHRGPVQLGRAPAVLVVSSIGVLLVALAYADGRDGIPGALTLYWIGQVVVFTPVAARLLWRRAAGVTESFMLVMGLAVNQYLLKWMYSPDQFRFPDELQHWLATTVLLRTDALFQPNPALPPAVHFPGLAEMGGAVADLTGLPVTAAGMLVAGGAHLLFVAALFALVLRLTDAPAVAGVACVVYATALHYLFFNSMYLYVTGALPFLMVAVWAVRRWRTGGGRAFAALAVVCMFATTATHHVTAVLLAMTLALVGAVELVMSGRARRWSALAMPAVAFAIVGAWVTFVAPDVIAYLKAPVDEALTTVEVLLGERPARASATTTRVSPVQLAVQGGGLLALFALYLGVGVDLLRRRDRDPWRWAVLIGAGLFFAGNGVRFLGQNGPEIAGRLNTYTYVPVSIVAGIALAQATRLLPRRNAAGRLVRGGPPPDAPPGRGTRLAVRTVVATASVTLLMVGARMGGWPPSWGLLPGPYLVGAYERSVDAAGIAAADWQRSVLRPGHRVAGDVTAVALSSTYGMQDPVREAAPLFYADRWSAADEQLVRDLAVDYLVVDRRLATDLPALDAYFEHDPMAGRHTAPMTAAQLAKFDDVPGADRLYDNGDIRIYRMGANR